MKITSNNAERELFALFELSESEREDFDYIDDETSPRLFRYKGNVYDVGDMMTAHGDLAEWDGYESETYFSGIVVRLTDEGVIVGHYFAS